MSAVGSLRMCSANTSRISVLFFKIKCAKKKKKIMSFVLFKWNLSGKPESGEVLATDFRYMDSLGLLGYLLYFKNTFKTKHGS